METTETVKRAGALDAQGECEGWGYSAWEEKVSRDPFTIFRGLMGDYREDGARISSAGHKKRMRSNRCTTARGNGDQIYWGKHFQKRVSTLGHIQLGFIALCNLIQL